MLLSGLLHSITGWPALKRAFAATNAPFSAAGLALIEGEAAFALCIVPGLLVLLGAL